MDVLPPLTPVPGTPRAAPPCQLLAWGGFSVLWGESWTQAVPAPTRGLCSLPAPPTSPWGAPEAGVPLTPDPAQLSVTLWTVAAGSST